MRVEYHPATASDLNNATTHYNAERPDLGNAFRTEVYATIDRILESPRLYAETEGVRRALVGSDSVDPEGAEDESIPEWR